MLGRIEIAMQKLDGRQRHEIENSHRCEPVRHRAHALFRHAKCDTPVSHNSRCAGSQHGERAINPGHKSAMSHLQPLSLKSSREPRMPQPSSRYRSGTA